ncbi:MAG: phospho-sugar mutase [Lachnospiraceae bacterium]|nr:phospho-sugar mutase [Lachnospiraceae bacterium]
MTYSKTANLWSEKLDKNDPLYKELSDFITEKNEDEIEDRFYKELSFGTAGLRGKCGVGTNRMNRFTVGRATQGIADYINNAYADKNCTITAEKSVVIAHDPRYFSREFSMLAACILAANGIKSYIFPDLRPTPELAFMVRYLGTVSGINITASHNPQAYNGYKAYWHDGCQVSSDVADGMTKCINAVDYFDGVRIAENTDFLTAYDWDMVKKLTDEYMKTGKVTMLDESYDRLYLDKIESISIHSGDDLNTDIPIIYTPLNGAGSIPFMQMMKERGFTNCQVVPEQKDPDPEFTTVGYPNPEDPKAFKLAEELGHNTGAELLMATDPDSDRFAIELMDKDGNYVPLNGNQTGYILVNYILDGHKSAGTLPENVAMVRSIVTSTMSSKIAASYGIKMYESLTGFKNICGLIPFIEDKNEKYLFGYEESVGYSACADIRDKDGISAGMLVAEAAAYYSKKGLTLFEVLDSLYQKYGYYAEDEPNIILEGSEGAARIGRMMEHIKNNPLTEVAGFKVTRCLNYNSGSVEDISNPENIIPATNAFRYFLDDGSENPDTWFAIRPSGTEPKIKFYFYTKQDSRDKALQVNEKIKNAVLEILKSVE